MVWLRLTLSTLAACAVLGGWIVSANQSGWVEVGLLALLPDLFVFLCALVAIEVCGGKEPAKLLAARLLLVAFPAFWISCVVFALIGSWAVAVLVALGAGVALEVTLRAAQRRINAFRQVQDDEDSSMRRNMGRRRNSSSARNGSTRFAHPSQHPTPAATSTDANPADPTPNTKPRRSGLSEEPRRARRLARGPSGDNGPSIAGSF